MKIKIFQINKAIYLNIYTIYTVSIESESNFNKLVRFSSLNVMDDLKLHTIREIYVYLFINFFLRFSLIRIIMQPIITFVTYT